MIDENSSKLGRLTYQSRVESWECDYNDHWNVRYYIRSFQMALDLIEASVGESTNNAQPTRHIRFHSELSNWSPVEIRSCVISDGEFQGSVLHILSSQNRIAASVLESNRYSTGFLPSVEAAHVLFGLPRGLDKQAIKPNEFHSISAVPYPLGTVYPKQFDHCGNLLAEEISRYANVLSHGFLNELGFTPEFRTKTAVSLMTVETKTTLHNKCVPGTILMGTTRIVSHEKKSFILQSDLYSYDHKCLFSSQDVLVSANLKTRRSVENPPFVAQRLKGL